ncbi:uncharacterized protein K452DRAFT_290282 [Aplosporella prunicola CBS 121167]|uniref:Uncharacterized protein n=1 Tax=Aplosporella prunicola CBS 121167 TaxID=1176127 RepID=A0A6A6B7G6_9PEZI|nr:uncharacterized protein K452DRAFT_290282 [Aplosporella prunicola CBS 121167]KAF2139185.1 hypothetical protein K452DRAFT_290282 [Aplosporella prunicola CBS 121167]
MLSLHLRRVRSKATAPAPAPPKGRAKGRRPSTRPTPSRLTPTRQQREHQPEQLSQLIRALKHRSRPPPPPNAQSNPDSGRRARPWADGVREQFRASLLGGVARANQVDIFRDILAGPGYEPRQWPQRLLPRTPRDLMSRDFVKLARREERGKERGGGGGGVDKETTLVVHAAKLALRDALQTCEYEHDYVCIIDGFMSNPVLTRDHKLELLGWVSKHVSARLRATVQAQITVLRARKQLVLANAFSARVCEGELLPPPLIELGLLSAVRCRAFQAMHNYLGAALARNKPLPSALLRAFLHTALLPPPGAADGYQLLPNADRDDTTVRDWLLLRLSSLVDRSDWYGSYEPFLRAVAHEGHTRRLWHEWKAVQAGLQNDKRPQQQQRRRAGRAGLPGPRDQWHDAMPSPVAWSATEEHRVERRLAQRGLRWTATARAELAFVLMFLRARDPGRAWGVLVQSAALPVDCLPWHVQALLLKHRKAVPKGLLANQGAGVLADLCAARLAGVECELAGVEEQLLGIRPRPARVRHVGVEVEQEEKPANVRKIGHMPEIIRVALPEVEQKQHPSPAPQDLRPNTSIRDATLTAVEQALHVEIPQEPHVEFAFAANSNDVASKHALQQTLMGLYEAMLEEIELALGLGTWVWDEESGTGWHEEGEWRELTADAAAWQEEEEKKHQLQQSSAAKRSPADDGDRTGLLHQYYETELAKIEQAMGLGKWVWDEGKGRGYHEQPEWLRECAWFATDALWQEAKLQLQRQHPSPAKRSPAADDDPAGLLRLYETELANIEQAMGLGKWVWDESKRMGHHEQPEWVRECTWLMLDPAWRDVFRHWGLDDEERVAEEKEGDDDDGDGVKEEEEVGR